MKEIRYGNTVVKFSKGADSRWKFSWKESGKRKQTSLAGNLNKAEARAREIAKRVDKGVGAVTNVSHQELEQLRRLQAVALRMKKSVYQVLEQLESENPELGNALFLEIYKSMEVQYKNDFSMSDETWNSLDDEFKAFDLKYLHLEWALFSSV